MTERLPATTTAALAKVRQLESLVAGLPQIPITTGHVLHGGMYARTICLPPGALITSAMVKPATLLIVDGDVVVYVGAAAPIHLQGRNVLPASAARKLAYLANDVTHLTMVMSTNAATIEEAEREFTDEVDMLSSRRVEGHNCTLITGE